MNEKRKGFTHRLARLGILAAMGVVLAALVRFPLIPSAAFLEYDAADIPILIGTFAFGPWQGLVLTAVVSVLQGVTVSAGSGPIGILMHFLATGALVLTAGLTYKAKKDREGAVLGLFLGSLAMILIMIPLNLFFTTRFLGVDKEVVRAMIVPVILPFNALKAGINAGVTFFVYKYAAKYLK